MPELSPTPQESQPSIPIPVPQAPKEAPVLRPTVHTLQSDLDHELTATDPASVQKMLDTAREQEAYEIDEADKTVARSWLSKGTFILVVLGLIALGFGVVHYTTLTVPVDTTASVGVFPSTNAIIANETPLASGQQQSAIDPILTTGRPALVPIITDAVSQNLLTPSQFFAYAGAPLPEPLIASLGTVRFGMTQHLGNTVPFIIATMQDPEVSAKEFQNTEATLAKDLANALMIDPQIPLGGVFVSGYKYNLPVRILERPSLDGGAALTTLLYGYPTNDIVVITTDAGVLKAVYDVIISQQ